MSNELWYIVTIRTGESTWAIRLSIKEGERLIAQLPHRPSAHFFGSDLQGSAIVIAYSEVIAVQMWHGKDES